MRAGRLDRRVTVQKRADTRGTAGSVKEAWADVDTLWMGKADVAGRRDGERWASAQLVAEIETVFTARWAPAFDEIKPDTHRLVYRGRAYEINKTVEIGRREGIEIACVARGEAKFGE